MEQITELSNLVGLGYTNAIIAEMLGVSERSVKNLRKKYNLRSKDLCGQITGVENRRATTLHRRVYQVEGPNSLWHIDGNHKLIRWRLIIHGGIDGYSRIPVFLCCSSNNKSETMLEAFKEGVINFGLPSKVRSDKGGENVLVCSFMMNHPLRGPHSKPFITGRSVHNQRVERLWRDVFTGCTSTYYELFSKMEDAAQLDASDDIDLAALHKVFIPLINNHLKSFQRSYMNHKIRTAGNRTPLQLYHTAIEEGHHVDFISKEEMDMYNHTQADFGVNMVNVPGGIPLTLDQQEAFSREFDLDVSELQLEQDQISYFVAAKTFLHDLLSN